MGKPVTGEVVVFPFPQTNLQSGKRRPALVVADLAGDDLVLCQISVMSRNWQYLSPAVKSGRGLPQSKTLRVFWRGGGRGSVLDCASPLALWLVNVQAILRRR